jgi:iron complex outermembrane receptor protein
VKTILIGIFSFFSIILSAQDCHFVLSGKVCDKDNEEGLAFSAISVKELNYSTQTNEKGEFSISNLCKGTYNLRIVHLGCSDTVIAVILEKNTKLHIKLPHSLHELSYVEVSEKTDYKTTQTQVEISATEMDRAKGKTLADALKNATGITTLNTGSSIVKPMLHGLQGYRILILNNGIRQEGQQWGNEHAPEIDPFIAKKMSVIKGASAVRYGSDALAGAILIEPNELPDTSAIKGEINLVGLSNGRAGVVSGALEGSLKKLKGFSWRLQGTLKNAGNTKTPEYYLKNTGVNEQNFSYAVGYHHKKFGTELFYSQFNSTIGVFSGAHIGNLTDLKAAFAQSKPQDSLASFSYSIARPRQEIAHELVKSKTHFHTGKRSRLQVVAAWQYNIRKEYDKHIPKNSKLYDTTKADLDYRITSKTADVVWEHDNINAFRGTYGVSFINQENVYLGRFLIPNFINNSWGAFAIERYVQHHHEFEFGIRYDEKHLQSFYYKNQVLQEPKLNFANWSLNGGWIYKINQSVRLYTNAGTAWRAPAVNELYSDGLHHGTASIEKGNAQLKQERCYNFISTIILRKKILEADISVYANYFKDFIYLMPGSQPELTIKGAFPVFYYRQSDALISGIDYKFKFNFGKHVEWETKGMFLRGRNLSENDWLVWMPSDRVQSAITYLIKTGKYQQQSRFTVSGEYITKQWRVPANSDYAAPPSGFFLLGADVSTSIRFNKQEINVGISGSNLLNTIYRDYLDRFRYYADAQGINLQFRLQVPFTIFSKK